MKFFPASLFTTAISNIDRNYLEIAEGRGRQEWSPEKLISSHDREEFRMIYEPLESFCSSLELHASVTTIRKMLACSKNPKATYREFFALGPEFSGRFKDETSGRLIYALGIREGRIALKPREDWEEIIRRFPDSATDIEEARTCYAMERYAAAVFHSLQVVEIGLIELGRLIVVTDHQTGWNATRNRLTAIRKTTYPNQTPFQQRHQKFLEQIAVTIELLHSAWRNKVSHAQDKLLLLRTDFTPAIAEEILLATRSFMRRLADECPTDPDPDA